MPATNTPRTHVRVRRSDGREWPSVFVAYRDLLGTAGELGYSEHQRMRAELRRGAVVRDRHGFEWRAANVAPIASISERIQRGEFTQHASPAQPTEAEVAREITAQFRWTDFTFGCEFELISPISMYELKDRLNSAGFNGWRVVHDGSVHGRSGFTGMEVVSPVLKGVEGLQTVRGLANKLEALGCKVNRTCGFHVHVGARTMSGTQLRKIAIAFINAEQHFDALVPAMRLNNQYCQSNAGRVTLNDAQRLQGASAVSTIATCVNGGSSPQRYNSFRYHKLNFQSFLQHGTIEFRQHGGTVQGEKAVNWIRLILGFCANAVNQPQQAHRQAVTFEEFLNSSTDEAGVTYLTARRNRLIGLQGQRRAA